MYKIGQGKYDQEKGGWDGAGHIEGKKRKALDLKSPVLEQEGTSGCFRTGS